MSRAVPTTGRPVPRTSTAGSTISVRLLGGWRVTSGTAAVHLPATAQRLVALVALKEDVSRSFVSGTLWPDVPEHRAHASLRSTLWRVGQVCAGLLSTGEDSLGLEPGVAVDVAELKRRFAEMLWRPGQDPVGTPWTESLAGDLLPGWSEDWVRVERERLRQMRVQALETITRSLAERGEYARALEVAMTTLAVAPLRESAHREIIRIHLAEGNHAEALRQSRVCAELLWAELGMRPSALMTELMASVPLRPRR